MNGYLLLCDFAEVLNGKLYIQGGGWSRWTFNERPMSFAVAGMIFVPWNDTNRRRRFSLTLFTADGSHVPDPEGNPVQLEGEFEVGRPPGVAPGTELEMPLSFKMDGLPLGPGRYRWEMRIDGTEFRVVPFEVVTPSGQAFGLS